MMDEILRRLQAINQQAVVLEKMVKQLRAERGQLQQQLAEAKTELEKREQALSELEEKYEAKLLIQGTGNGQDHEELRSKIDSYLEEIDFCLKNFGDQS